MAEGEEEDGGEGLRHQRKWEEFKKMGHEIEMRVQRTYRRKRLGKWCSEVVMTRSGQCQKGCWEKCKPR